MKLHIIMIDAAIKAYPDPARAKREECIAQAAKFAEDGGHEFELMGNAELQPYFDEPVEDMDYGPVLTFARIGDPLRFRKASYIPNLVYLDTDVYLKYIPDMLPGKPYLAGNFIIGTNGCCDTIKKIVRERLTTSDAYYEFPTDCYTHHNLSADRIRGIDPKKLEWYYKDPTMCAKNRKPWMTWIEGEDVQFGGYLR